MRFLLHCKGREACFRGLSSNSSEKQAADLILGFETTAIPYLENKSGSSSRPD